MVRCFSAAGILFLFASAPFADAADLSGTWFFTHAEDRFRGTIILRQSGSAVTGTWHTALGKTEPDSPVAGQVSGNAVKFTRTMGNLEQNYTLVLSKDGQRLDGFGEGWGIIHANLNMQREGPSAPPAARRGDHLSFPPDQKTWKWGFQSVAQHRGSEIKYINFYYEASTGKSIDSALPLPMGGVFVGVFPDDCPFGAVDDKGAHLLFSGQEDSKGRQLAPGTWVFYPSDPPKCGGVVVFLK